MRSFAHHRSISLMYVNEMEVRVPILMLGNSIGGLMDNSLV